MSTPLANVVLTNAALIAALALVGCSTPTPTVDPPQPALRRLSQAQYNNTLHDLFGDELVLPSRVEPDTSVDGYFSVGGTFTTISPRGVELYEEAAYDVAEQLLANPSLRARAIPCESTAPDCARHTIETTGRRLWRRPLTADEVDAVLTVHSNAESVLGTWDGGAEYALATLLQSPNFLFRAELGEPDPDSPGTRRYTNHEMASRLSYFLWNTTPDDALLDAAAAGELTTDDGLSAQIDRMLQDERARGGARQFFSEMLRLERLDELSKDPLIFTHMSDELGPDARTETLMLFEHMVFDQDADYRDLFTTRTTFVNNRLAALYNVPSPAREGFAITELPQQGERAGVLGHASVLAQYAHPVSGSPTLRGKFIREVVLCQPIPDPPSGVDTSIPEPSGNAPTLRDRVAEHLANPDCASCHELTDPVGLGLENFDGIGRWRVQDNGVTIDASGDLDGDEWVTAGEMTEVLRDHDDLPPCLVHNLFRYSTAHAPVQGELDALDALEKDFKKSGYRISDLMRSMALSPAFRQAGAVDTSAEPSDE